MKYLHLNFHEVFIERLRVYARRHGMKLNAVLKQAFELLEDTEAQRDRRAKELPKDDYDAPY